MSSTLMEASAQWATRPDDERFTSLTDLHNAVNNSYLRSRSRVVASRDLTVSPVSGSKTGLVIAGPQGNAMPLTHYAFGQLAGLAKAPAGYLRSLHPNLVADNLNYGLKVLREVEDVGVLLSTDKDESNETFFARLRAVTGPNYGRIWNRDITEGLLDAFGDGVTGDFRVPGVWGKPLDAVTKDNTTLYAGDRDMFVFLADEAHRITVPDRRDGRSGTMARGFFVWNSEVGATTFGVKTFLFDEVCQNRIVWGATQVKELRIRHTAKAPHRFIEEIRPALLSYVGSSAVAITKGIEDARKARLDNVDDFLATRFGSPLVEKIKAAHESDEGRPIETAWDAVTGATAHARTIAFQPERIELEEKAGMIIDI